MIVVLGLLIASTGITPIIIIEKLQTNENNMQKILSAIRESKLAEHNTLQNTILAMLAAHENPGRIIPNGTHFIISDHDNKTVAIVKDIPINLNRTSDFEYIVSFNNTLRQIDTGK